MVKIKLIAGTLSAVLGISAVGAATSAAIQTRQQSNNLVQSVPEDIQETGTEIMSLNDLPTYEYSQQEIEVYNGTQKIYGIAYIPQTGKDKLPLMICSHGLGGSYRSNLSYAQQLAEHGIAAYCFDFRGGGGSNSDGSVTEMSIMTEVSDLECIISAAKQWNFVDTNNISLLGTSQGGIVSAITAARHTDDVNGLILCYPAFVAHDSVREMFSTLDEVPDTYRFEWMTLGRPYAEDIWDYDVYAEIGNYTKKVLLMHGTADSIVPISYSEKAAEVYSDVEYYPISGAGHGFSGNNFNEAAEHIFSYVQEIGILANEPVQYDIDDVRNLQDFLLAKPTAEDLTGKPYDMNGDGRWDVFDLCLMKREVLNSIQQENEIKIVPESYNSSAEQQGTVETFTYDTNGYTKTAYVYLPYGYDENSDEKYNILYFMHGGGGNAGQFYNRSYALNDILDHAIESGEIEPLIVVTPTFYNPDDNNTSVANSGKLVSVFHEEFINDLMPSVESHYKTYAETTDTSGLEKSREHRAFGGFSMGSVTTWYQFTNSLDYVAFFMPLSGDCWEYGTQGGASHPEETAAFLNDFALSHKYHDDFYIYGMTGGNDIALNAMSSQINAMKDTEAFRFGTSSSNGNITFQILDGATHDYTYYRNYIYTILPYFFKEKKTQENKVLVTYFSTPEITDATTTASRIVVDGQIFGTTEYMAQVIHDNTDSDLFKIELEEPYGSDVAERAKSEQENGILPKLSTHIENLDQYDTIYIGYPTWWYDMPQVMYSFFDEYDFSGKKIIPFNSHGGSRFSGSIEKIVGLEPNADVSTEGLTLSRGSVATSKEEIINWIAQFNG